MPEEVDRTGQLRELVDAIHVESSATDVFRASTPEWWGERIFGGMIVAQTLNAALQTVDDTLVAHSMHGYFLGPVAPRVDSELIVERLRDGRSFSLRQATMYQQGRMTSRFFCSFHVPEDGDEYQLTVQDVPGPETLEIAASSGPFDACDVGPTPPGPDGTYRSTARLWNRTCAPLDDDPLVHACMMAFFSDMTRTSFRPLSLDMWVTHTDVSLDHAVWFHRPARADEWFFSDFQALVNAGGRGVVRGTMHTRSGILCMSMAQELLIRRLPGQGSGAPWTLNT